MRFAQKVKRGEKTILYEFLPPPKDLSKSDLDNSMSFFAKMLARFPVDGINLPEVREEIRHGMRKSPEIIKTEPRIVSSYLRKHGKWDIIINRPVVYLPWQKQERWLLETYTHYNIQNFIFVGGESSKITYPGLSVSEAAKKVTNGLAQTFPDILLGGITIPTRKDEAKRVFDKTLSGLSFFTSQIIYEPQSMKKLLREYWQLCVKNNIKPKMIFLSFAPVATLRDIELLQWLGVEIPHTMLKKLTTGWLGMGWRSIQICEDILGDILRFTRKNAIAIPLGLNVEHVNRHNFEASLSLLEKLLKSYLGAKRRTFYD